MRTHTKVRVSQCAVCKVPIYVSTRTPLNASVACEMCWAKQAAPPSDFWERLMN